MQSSIAEAAGVSIDAVEVVLSKGSLVVTATIMPSAENLQALATRLQASSAEGTLASQVAQAASEMPQIDLVTTGAITATVEVATPAPSPSPTLAPVSSRDGFPNTSFSDRTSAKGLAITVLMLSVAL